MAYSINKVQELSEKKLNTLKDEIYTINNKFDDDKYKTEDESSETDD